MTSTFFDRALNLIFVEARIAGPFTQQDLVLIVDTGAAQTIIVPDVIDDIGYSARDAYSLSSVTSPLGREYGYRLRVGEFVALGHAFADYPVAVHDLADRSGIDGLPGWDFLSRFNLNIRPREGRIDAEMF
jgi:hypothetical protein